MNQIIQNSRLFLRVCGIRIADLKLDHASSYRVVFRTLKCDFDGVSQIERVIAILGRPEVQIKANGDNRVYTWNIDAPHKRVLRIRTWYEQGCKDYGFYADIEDGERRDQTLFR